MLRVGWEPELERGAQLVVRLVVRFAGGQLAARRPAERRGAGTAPRAGRPVSLLSSRVPPTRGAS